MHLQLNLSNQLIKQWKPELTDEPPETHPLLQWRIDKIKLANTTANYICVNEATLFSFLLPKIPDKTLPEVLQYFTNRLLVFLEDYFFPPGAAALLDACPVEFGKTTDRKLIASVTDMRFRYEDFYYEAVPLEEAETRINETPLKRLNYEVPMSGFLNLRDLVDDPHGSLLRFKMPARLVYAARQSLWGATPPALHCLNEDPADAMAFMGLVTLADLMVFRNVVQAALQQPTSFEIKKKLFPVFTYLDDILSNLT